MHSFGLLRKFPLHQLLAGAGRMLRIESARSRAGVYYKPSPDNGVLKASRILVFLPGLHIPRQFEDILLERGRDQGHKMRLNKNHLKC